MRKLLICWALLMSLQLQAQDSSEIFLIVDESPYFPGCAEQYTDTNERKECTSKATLAFMYKFLQYPIEAIQDSVEGQVVARFAIEKDGTITNAEILKDIGKGCGEEVLRVVNGMNQLPEKWTPGKKDGAAVRSYFTVPVKFKIPEYKEPEFTLIGPDTIWTKVDQALQFKGGNEGLDRFITENLVYPQEGLADCQIGEIDVQLLVRPNGQVGIVDILDYSNLGIDFLYETVDWGYKTANQWDPAMKNGRGATSPYTIRLFFMPPTANCSQRIEEFKLAKSKSEEAIVLFESGKNEEAIEKWNTAVGLFPDNSEFLSLRGQAFMDNNRLNEACADLSKAQDILMVSWYHDILKLICRDEPKSE